MIVLWACRGQSQNDVAIGLAWAAHLTEPVDKLAIEPEANQSVLVDRIKHFVPPINSVSH
jgi:hypothetical protein